MATKSDAEVIIGGKIYTLSGYENPEYLQKVAAYLNQKMNELKSLEGYQHLSTDLKNVLLNINIVDDYFKAKETADRMEKELQEKDRELYDANHELVSAKMNEETLSEALKDSESKNRELLMNKAKLETTLEDALLGTEEKEETKS
ncbi:cell division protein ZapA [Eubacterium oxidoreducens]|uniref:Cell division protein ZapA n=1 Tax=Eubacterium oxidoreducens TaxID=1732 RepID=A0A1G6AND5_EUBOX|nr:cell division protein ZapA [Eubacterium oxidoreducens]SDB09683.1 cell division protein ZapA [Eubacterium oxidoreducens]